MTVPHRDPMLDSSYPRRSLSEQLRILERELSRADDAIAPLVAPSLRLPTSLGRPIGVRSVEFPSLASLSIGADARTLGPAVPTTRGPSFGRTAAIALASVLLLATTAIVPPLIWRHADPAATEPQAGPPAEGSLRTEDFAHSARNLVAGRHALAPATMLTVPEGDLGRLTNASGATTPSEPTAPHLLPTSRFEPAAGEGEAILDEATTTSRPNAARGPARPPAPSAATSSWASRAKAVEQVPSWVPFGNR